MIFRWLILNLVLSRCCILCSRNLVALIDETGVSRAVSHDHSCRVDNLWWHASHEPPARIWLESCGPSLLGWWWRFTLAIPFCTGCFNLLQAVTLELELVVWGVGMVGAGGHIFIRVLVHRAVVYGLEEVLVLGWMVHPKFTARFHYILKG